MGANAFLDSFRRHRQRRWDEVAAGLLPPPEPVVEPEPEPVVTPEPEPEPPLTPDSDTLFGVTKAGEPVVVSMRKRCEHTLLLGKTGQGKSNLLRHLMRQDMMAGRGFVCLDPHGSLIDAVLSDVPQWRQDDVISLDAADEEWPFGLNLFELPTRVSPRTKATMISQLLQVFAKCWQGGFSGTAEVILKSVCQTFLDNRQGTLATIPRLLTDRDYRETFYPRITDPYTTMQWKRITNSRTGDLKAEETDPIMRRLMAFVGNPIVVNIMGQTRTTLDFPRWMAEGKIVLIKIPDNDSDGVGKDAAQLLAAVILQLIVRAAYGREVGSTLWSVYADEFQHYVTGDIPEMIQNLRKYGVGLTLATQSFANISDEAVRDSLLGVGTLLCYQLTDKDARIVAGEFREGVETDEDWAWDREGHYVYRRPAKSETASRLASLKALVGVGGCLVKSDGREFVVKVPNLEKERPDYPTASRAAIIRQSRETYCRPRYAVERELRRELLPDTEVREDDESVATMHEGGEESRAAPPPPTTPGASTSLPPPSSHHTRRRGVIAPLPATSPDDP